MQHKGKVGEGGDAVAISTSGALWKWNRYVAWRRQHSPLPCGAPAARRPWQICQVVVQARHTSLRSWATRAGEGRAAR